MSMVIVEGSWPSASEPYRSSMGCGDIWVPLEMQAEATLPQVAYSAGIVNQLVGPEIQGEGRWL